MKTNAYPFSIAYGNLVVAARDGPRSIYRNFADGPRTWYSRYGVWGDHGSTSTNAAMQSLRQG